MIAMCTMVEAVSAQQVELLPSAVSRCLQPAAEQRGAPEYPLEAWKLGEPGRVKVELAFTTPDAPPRVTVLEKEGPASMVDAVQEHVRIYRAPCLTAAEAPGRLVIEFVFAKDNRQVFWSDPADLDERERRNMATCMVHPKGRKRPDYPADALRAEVQGNVLARLRFSGPDTPPEVEIFAGRGMEPLTRAVRFRVADFRLPCHSGPPLEVVLTYQFRFEGEVYGMKPLGLTTLMRAVRGIETTRLVLDTTEMGCPFDLQFQLRQPFLPNQVAEVEVRNPSRRPLIEWLRSIEFDVPRESLAKVYGDTTTVGVPCLKIDLNPKEKNP